MSTSSDYNINFFKPASDFMRANIKLIAVIMVFWALAVFGFHGLMKIIESPTPEPAYLAYQDAWPAIKEGRATTDQKKALARTCLTLTGKYIELRGNPEVAQLFSHLVRDLMTPDQQAAFSATARALVSDKRTDVASVATALDLADAPLLARMVPYTLVEPQGSRLSKDTLARIPGIMDKYLIHYQSVMTDTLVLGFPFHYLYTAVILMIIFCLLCLAYCAKIDKVMIRFGLESNEAGGQ